MRRRVHGVGRLGRVRFVALAFGLPLLASLALLPGTADAQLSVPPDADYRQFDTEHFRVVFKADLEAFARRAAASAEWAYTALSRRFIEPPGGRISLIVAEPTDGPNAAATPIPTNRVVLIAAPSIGSRQLNYYTDWLDETLVHELTHIFHLDEARGLWTVPRTLFGRFPAFFPAFYQPRWVIEGLATYYESRLTGTGRAYGSYFDMLLTSAAERGDLRSIDAANGLTPEWPSGQTPYAYGGLYFRDLAEEHGDSAIAEFVRRGAGRVPYTLDWAGRPAFGHSLSDGWERWTSEYRGRARARADSVGAPTATAGVPLSPFSWILATPRFAPDGRRLAYTEFTAREDPAVVVVDVETGRTLHRIRRNGGGLNDWSPDGSTLYLDQSEFVDRWRIYGDLYALDASTGDDRRLTRGARLEGPDVAPDGRSALAVQVGQGTNRLVRVDLAAGEVEPLTRFDPEVNWQRPRWSPDGSRIAVERWVHGRVLDIVILDPAGRVVREVTRDAALDMSPAWSPDGRYVLWSSDRGGTVDLFAADVSSAPATDGRGPTTPVLRITRTPSGAFDPDVSADGRWIAYSALYDRGFRIERIPYDPTSWEPAPPPRDRTREPPTPPRTSASAVGGPVRGYSPFPSVWPRSWLPIAATGGTGIGTLVGATTFGSDDLARHSFGLFLGWRTEARDLEGGLVYRYRGLGDPVLQLAATQELSSFLARTSAGDVVSIRQREREVRLSGSFLRRRVRNALRVTPSLEVHNFHFEPIDASVTLQDPTVTDLEAGLGIGFATDRSFPRSVSPEDGVGIGLALTHRRRADDLDRWRVSAELVLTGYQSVPLFGFADHVLAARLAGGISSGRGLGAETFFLGGVPGRAFEIVPGFALGGGDDYPVRGFVEGVQAGDRVVAGSLEYRLPLALVGRGYKLWPALIDRLSGSLFVDAGAAWSDTDRIRSLASAGAELSLDLGVGYSLVYRFRLGLARQVHTPAGADPEWDVYLTAGIAF